jgi:hypothetical protein
MIVKVYCYYIAISSPHIYAVPVTLVRLPKKKLAKLRYLILLSKVTHWAQMEMLWYGILYLLEPFAWSRPILSVTHTNHWNLLVLYAMVSFGASEAVKDIFPLFITVAFHYVFPPNSLWVKHGPIERTLRVISENVIIVRFSSEIFYCLERFPMTCSHQC